MAAKDTTRIGKWRLWPLGTLCCLALLSPALAGSDDYLGSQFCAFTCHVPSHVERYNDHKLSGHPYKLMRSEEAQYRPIPLPLGFTWDDISYVIGGYKWKSRYVGTDGYIITTVDTDLDGTPETDGMNQYNYLTGAWSNYHPGEMKPYDCGRCHTTGWVQDEDFDTDNDLTDNQDGLPGMHGTFAFGGIQCEACHGPGAHLNPANENVVDTSSLACGSCHNRNGPDTVIEASGGFIRHHEQFEEFQASPHASALSCVDCHDPHKPSALSIKEGYACADCHQTQAASYAGTPMDKLAVTCEDCHMPAASKSAQALGPFKGDVMTHIFRINPDYGVSMFTSDGSAVQLDGNGKAAVTVDFACLSCHTTETTRWAAFYAKDFHGRDPARDIDVRDLPRFKP